jgi:rubrerythrin
VRSFHRLSEREVLAISLEDDARIYEDLAAAFQPNYTEAADEFRRLRADEDGHRHRLLELYWKLFVGHFPLVCREHIRGVRLHDPTAHSRMTPESAPS